MRVLTGRKGDEFVRKTLVALALVAIVAIVAAPATAGGKGNGRRGGASGTFSLVLMDGATQPVRGGRITFDVTASVDRPFVGLRCWQGYDLVGDGYVGYFSSYPYDPWFNLDSPYWHDGEQANCTARLFYFNKRGVENVLSTMQLLVAP